MASEPPRSPGEPAGPSPDSGLAGIVRRNIRTLVEARAELQRRRGLEEAIADSITRFTGSLRFVVLHTVLVSAWIAVNLGVVPGVSPFDPFPFVMLAMVASVEAIFLSTFVLISQNRMQAIADRRADLDLQITLLAEHEVTRLITMVEGIERRLGVDAGRDAHLEELKRDITPEVVLDEIERAEREKR